MRRFVCSAALIAWVQCLATPAQAQSDSYVGPDKALHFSVSAALALGFYGVGSAIWDTDPPRAAFAGATALAFGIAKEVYDLADGRIFSGPDLFWDVVGSSVGTLFGFFISWLVRRSRVPAQCCDIAEEMSFVWNLDSLNIGAPLPLNL